MSTSINQRLELNIAPYRRRIVILRAWQYAALGGCVGAGISIISLIGDRFDLWDASPLDAALLVAVGVVFGAVSSLFGRYSDAQIASSIDRRSQLEERLTTVYEYGDISAPSEGQFLNAVTADTIPRLNSLRPSTLFPLRPRLAHAVFAALAATAIVLYVALDTPLLLTAASKQDAAKLKQQAEQVQQVARPLLKEADQPNAPADEKQLAKSIRRFVRDLEKNRLSKQAALIRANQLATQAKLLEQKRNLAFGQTIDKAQTAGDSLAKMEQNESLQKTDEAQAADKAAALGRQADQLQSQIASLQNLLNKASGGKSGMSRSQMAQLKSQLASLKKQLQQVEISKQAAENLAKTMALPDYQEAQKLLQEKAEEQEAENLLLKLQQQNDADQTGQQQLTQQQLNEIASQLEALAKQLDTDAKRRAYAKALLEAAKQARMGNGKGMAVAIAGAFGLSGSYGSQNDYGPNGASRGMPGPWRGYYGTLNRSDKSSLLNLKIPERQITSQIGNNGPATYEDQIGPAHLDAKSGIPYQAMLPKYEQTEESALSKGDIPLEMRDKVRDYFDSLQHGP